MNETAVCGDPTLAYLFDEENGKYNNSVVLTEEDALTRVKILCKEPYAQSLYDAYNNHTTDSGMGKVSKDFVENQEYSVKATTIDMDNKIIRCDEVATGSPIFVSFSDYIGDIMALKEDPYFKIILIKTVNGVFYGSNKIYSEITYFEELHTLQDTQEWFDVKIIELIKGGYRALYKNCVKCFIPGSHAAANIITDFNELIGKTIPVIIDSYDHLSKLYIVSYKKYIKASMPTKINELEFGKKYDGKLTSKPTKYGLFVEFENYYTGLVHATEFENYHDTASKLTRGDHIDIYVKDVQIKDDQFRIVLTLNPEKINADKLYWTKLKESCEGATLDYFFDESSQKFYIISDEMGHIGLSLDIQDVKNKIGTFKKVIIHSIDIISQNIQFDFC